MRQRRMAWAYVAFAMALFAMPVFAQGAPGPTEDPRDPFMAYSVQAILSWLAVVLIDFLKKSAWFKWVNEGSWVANRVAATILAALATVGVGVTYDTAAAQLVISGLSATAIVGFLVEFAKSWVEQKLMYMVKRIYDARVPSA